MDADIGVQVCGLSYMKGHVAHAGFPEISYGSMSDSLVRAGYKVGRVEQTETPDQLNVRKKQKRNGPTPKVVNREVCSIVTVGTRTFCYLDDTSSILNEEATAGGNSSTGPLLAIREILLESASGEVQHQPDDSNEIQPVCEYGVTLVDAVRGSVTIGQFADDVLRSRLTTLLATFSPSEVGTVPLVCSVVAFFCSRPIFLLPTHEFNRLFWKEDKVVHLQFFKHSFVPCKRLLRKTFEWRPFFPWRVFLNRQLWIRWFANNLSVDRTTLCILGMYKKL